MSRQAPDWTTVLHSRLRGVEAYEGSWRSQASPEHFHPAWQVTLGLAGSGAIRHLGLEGRWAPGRPFVFRPWEPHAIGPAAGRSWHFISLHLAPGFVEAATPAAAPEAGQASGVLQKLLLSAFKAIRDGRGVEPAIERLASALAGLKAPASETRAAPGGQVLAARAHLLGHLDRRVEIAELAEAVGASPRTLARAFRAAVGLSPHAFHLQARIHQAKALLLEGMPLAEVAAATGFVDQAHLTRHFARLVRTPPGRWKAGGRNVQDRRRRPA